MELISKLEIHKSFTSLRLNGAIELLKVIDMVTCPECGEPLVKRSRARKYYCENERCSVIYVQRPHQPTIMRVVHRTVSVAEREQVSS